jgi:hypothetical protein
MQKIDSIQVEFKDQIESDKNIKKIIELQKEKISNKDVYYK